MRNVVASFNIEPNNPLEIDYEISEPRNVDCVFEINAVRVFWGGIEGNVNDQTDLIELIEIKIENATATYIHEQGVSADIWNIEHNLGKFPSVTLVDTAGTQFQGRVEYIDENNCTVYMNGATKGKAYLN